MKTLLSLLLLLVVSVTADAQIYRPTAWSSIWVSTMQNAAQARAYLGVSGITNYGATVTNWTMYGTTLVGSTTNSSLTANTVPYLDANKVLTSSAVTPTTLGYLDATSSIQTQLNSHGNTLATNVALLGGTNTYTGTNIFPAAQFYPANNIGLRLLWTSPTNIYIDTVAVGSNLTNNGDFSLGTYVAKFQCPRLLGSNSSVGFMFSGARTNANVTVANLNFYVGSNTNYVSFGTGLAATVGNSQYTLNTTLFQNAGAFTSQMQGNVGTITTNGPGNFVDTSAEFTIYVSASTTTSFTNALFYGLRFYEVYAP